jgi:hypothetical protein
MPAALIKMSVAERERYVRWWIEESGLTPVQLRDVAGAVWSEDGESRTADVGARTITRPRRPPRREL